MKRFKFTLFIAVVFILAFLSIGYLPENVNKITVSNIEEKGSYTYITGNISPIKAYKGYEYSSNNGKCYIKIYSSFRLFGGSNEYKIHVGNFDDIYFTDGKSNKKITKSKMSASVSESVGFVAEKPFDGTVRLVENLQMSEV